MRILKRMFLTYVHGWWLFADHFCDWLLLIFDEFSCLSYYQLTDIERDKRIRSFWVLLGNNSYGRSFFDE